MLSTAGACFPKGRSSSGDNLHSHLSRDTVCVAVSSSIAPLLADAILVLHAGLVVCVLLGAGLIPISGRRGWRWVRQFHWRLAHVLLIVFIAVQTWLGELCPLTVWEQQLRRRAGQSAYAESFIAHWLSRLIFFDVPWWMFTAAYTAFALLVLLLWIRVRPEHPH
jgi:hypothetical protein